MDINVLLLFNWIDDKICCLWGEDFVKKTQSFWADVWKFNSDFYIGLALIYVSHKDFVFFFSVDAFVWQKMIAPNIQWIIDTCGSIAADASPVLVVDLLMVDSSCKACQSK